jgi:hypothetical protein
LNETADQYVFIELDLKEHGKATFRIDTQSDYVNIADEIGMSVLGKFYDSFDTGLDDKGKKRSLL